MADGAHEAPAQARAGHPIRQPSEPIPVMVWIDAHRTRDQRCEGWAIAWTPRQVQVTYLDRHGREGTAWVWASAVERR